MVLPDELEVDVDEGLTPLQRLSKDLKEAAKTLGKDEIRYLVDDYYANQKYRKATKSQWKALEEAGEPHRLLKHFYSLSSDMESQLQRALDSWSDDFELGRWAKSVVGVGPIITAGLMANLDIEQAPTAGHYWSFCGLDPKVIWLPGEKRPWNASLKTLCFNIGECFVKVSNHPNDFYGRFYVSRKQKIEWPRNLEGKYADQAALVLEKKQIRKVYTRNWYEGKYNPITVRAWLEKGKDLLQLPVDTKKGVPMLAPAHIQMRSKRVAVKIFLSHFHAVEFEIKYGRKPPVPYILEHGKEILGTHQDYYAPPNWPMKEAKKRGRKRIIPNGNGHADRDS